MNDTNNSLAISSQFPQDKFNVLIPMQTVTSISDIQKPVMNSVKISTNLADKEIYIQEKAKAAWKDRPATPNKYAIAKKGLAKLMRAAGIKVISSKSVLPSTCQKCAQVNASIGKPINCGACPNKDVKFEVAISVPQLTGDNLELIATKEVIVADVTDGMTEKQAKEFLKFRSEMCETKALNRALRTAMQIKSTYLIEEFEKPFVVAYLVPNLDNEAVKDEAVKHFFDSQAQLFGSNKKQSIRLPEEDDIVDEPQHQAQPTAAPENNAAAPVNTDPLADPVCHCCNSTISQKVYEFSMKKYNEPLCMSCQAKKGK